MNDQTDWICRSIKSLRNQTNIEQTSTFYVETEITELLWSLRVPIYIVKLKLYFDSDVSSDVKCNHDTLIYEGGRINLR